MVRPNVDRFIESLGIELSHGATRVRDLIGARHWGVDGAHKESIFRAFLEPHLPAGIICRRGFVLGPDHALTSTEQDLLLVDINTRAPVFMGHDLVLAAPESVVGAISVKTQMNSEEVDDAIAGLSTLLKTCVSPWLGAFFFDDRRPPVLAPTKLYEHVQRAIVHGTPAKKPLDAAPGDGIDALADMHSTCLVVDHSVDGQTSVRGYDCNGKAAAVFLARLLGHVATSRGPNSWMAAALDRVAMTPLTPSSATWQASAPPPGDAKKKKKRRKPRKRQ